MVLPVSFATHIASVALLIAFALLALLAFILDSLFLTGSSAVHAAKYAETLRDLSCLVMMETI